VEDATSASAAGADDLARAEKASDPATAANWLWAATKKGNTDAPVRLADYYANGRGVPKDCEQATVLLRSSARRGNPRARARLGMYYATGLCVAQDRSQAWHWLSLAHQSDPGSDWIEQYRQRLWSQMTPDERARSNSSSTASE
jgi:TPR repeat protein